ncbi:MAG: efflux RND transporter periplasmic adaptor subunit [Acidobacteriota bacterium]|nr:efflux RND transporter periplasmic adaptor subunit [Acidobacteriota bacterium]
MQTELKTLEPGREQKLLDDPAHPRVPAPPSQKARRGRAAWIGLGLLLLLAILFLAGYLPRHKREQGINREAKEEETSLPIVTVTQVKHSAPTSELLLPGNITPLTEAYIYARAAGYLKRRYVDIGDRVRQGQLMAEIEAPDLDQQVIQGRASLQQARANLGQTQASLEQSQAQQRLTGVTLGRWKTLVARGVLAQQEGDQKQADYDNATALVHVGEANIRAAQDNVRASEANVARLVELQGFEKIRAPFTGIVTARSVDVGSLIAANGSGQGNPNLGGNNSGGNGSGELFRVAQIERLRILVNVPQTAAPSIHLGLPANVTVQEYYRRKVTGKVTRTSNSLDPNTRTLLTEVQVNNTNGTLLPGMYAQVQFVTDRISPPILIPGDSLVIRSKGPEVAILAPGNKVHFVPVTVGRDYGIDIEITSGLNGGEYVVVNPNDDVREGAEVKPASANQKAGGVAGSAASSRKGGGNAPNGPSDQKPSGIGREQAPAAAGGNK